MTACTCSEPHERRRVVLTGGPGAGKTAVLELIRQSFCVHVKVLPEAAGIIFGGGFPRDEGVEQRRAAQRAIFYVQREVETATDAGNAAVVMCTGPPSPREIVPHCDRDLTGTDIATVTPGSAAPATGFGSERQIAGAVLATRWGEQHPHLASER
jgi:hypothetical protein